jgi:tetratricopeptide (TPR) repeat protein
VLSDPAVTYFGRDEPLGPGLSAGPRQPRPERHEVSRRRGNIHAGLRWLGHLALPCLLVHAVHAGEPAPGDLDPCPGEPAAAQIESAKASFRAGQTAFNEGAYARSAEYWSLAYQQDCTAHALLLNLAMAQELLGRPNEALHALRLFNRRVPDSSYADSNRKRIERLERAAVEKAQLQAQHEDARRELAAASTPLEEPSPARALPLPLVAVVAGGIASVTGAALYAEARYSAARAAENCGAPRADCRDLDAVVSGERARARAETAGWVTGVGLATVAGGTLLYVLTAQRPLDDPRRQDGLGLATSVGRSSAALYWNGHF